MSSCWDTLFAQNHWGATPVVDGAEVSILPAVSGGTR
jgi:hypothetical protein